MDKKKLPGLLDSCVKKARVAEESQREEDWSSAEIEADKLDHLLNAVEAGQCVAQTCLAVEAFVDARWITAIASVATIFALGIHMWLRKHKH